ERRSLYVIPGREPTDPAWAGPATGSTSDAGIHPRETARRMGRAKRHPSIAFLGDDGFRRAQPILLAERDLLNRINVICPVQRHLQKYFGFILTQISSLSRT